MKHKFYYIGGLTKFNHKRFIGFLFGEDCIIKSVTDYENYEYKFYVKKSSFQSEERMKMKDEYESFFTGVKIIPID